jgi:hypothetical protein
MKKVLCIISLLGCFILPVSCLTTLQPLVTDNNAIIEDRIIGSWEYDKGTIQIKRVTDAIKPKDFTTYRTSPRLLTSNANKESASFNKTYLISFERNGIGYDMIGAVTKIQDDLFIEIAPSQITDPQRLEGSGYEYNYSYLPTLTIAKLVIKNNQSLDLEFLNGDYIKEQIDDGRMRIKHEKDRLFNTFVITASSDELSKFFEKYGNNDRLFSPKNSITLIRKG